MAVELPGVCGPANRACKIAHVSSYPTDIGVYPSQCLPSTFTIWHAVFASQFLPQVDIVPVGGSPLDIFLPGGGLIVNIVLSATHTFQSHHYVIFARTAIRFNIPHTVTEEEAASIDAAGRVEIDLGEYVFEAVSATKVPIEGIEESIELTLQEKSTLEDDPNCSEGCTSESEDNRKFRKLFELSIPNNLLVGVGFNKLGVEYRLDNGSRKSNDAIDQAGLGDLNNASYRDGTSKKLIVQFSASVDEASEGDVSAGDVLYLTYVAVREHYLRQRISISWQVFDPGTAEFASTCISLPLGHSIAHYRFYEWDVEPEGGQQQPTKLAGWRVVESFSTDVSFVAPITVSGIVVLADFLVGGADFPVVTRIPVLRPVPPPSLDSDGRLPFVTLSQLQTFIDDRSSFSISEFRAKYGIDVALTDSISNGAYHVNAGKAGASKTLYEDSAWFQRNAFSKYTNRIEASNHVFYNVHPKALIKRDIDKWGIERFLAVEIEKDVKAGTPTSFPFMDDPEVDNPITGSNNFLDSSNLFFEPVLPVTSYGGNFDARCGSIGSFPTNPSDGINSYHSFESNRIEERFEIDTNILVERNFAVGAGPLGPNLITIECAAGVRGGGAVSCIVDPSGGFAFVGHANEDNFVTFNPFNIGYVDEGIRNLIYRPDEGSPPIKENNSPTVDQFEALLGFSSMLGDAPGYQPGRAISPVAFSSLGNLIFQTTGVAELKRRIPDLDDSQIEEITFSQGSSLIVSVSNGYYGSMRITYSLSSGSATGESREAFLLAKLGGSESGIVDTIDIQDSENRIAMSIGLRWMRADSFELIGPRVQHMNIEDIVIEGISSERTGDFLSDAASHTQSFVDSSLSERLEGRNLFFETSVVTISEDQYSILYLFFSDSDGGISSVATNDFGDTWYYYYGVIEQIAGIEILHPFAVTDFGNGICYLFYLYSNKILCKKIPLSQFKIEDANLVERFADIFTPADSNDSGSVSSESESIFTEEGHALRRRIPSFIAKGDLTDEAFLELLGKVPGSNEYERFETRLVDGKETTVLKVPISRSPGTAFANQDHEDMFFSVYRNDVGELKLWFMDETSDGSSQLQCNFSVDDGQTWYDLWEFVEHGYNRLRYDSAINSQFIDLSASGESPTSLEGNDPEESDQSAPFGINVHWSRLKRHKENEGEVTINSESQVLEISSPYLFHQPTTDRVFLFYVYQGCLLCKVFSDSIFLNAVESKQKEAENSGITLVKEIIEQQTRAHFIDGSLTSESLQEELHRFVRDNEIMAEGNIFFGYPFAIDVFTDDRVISAQRVCAHDMQNSLVRVFYKHVGSSNLKSAIWTGSEWWAEDFLRDPTDLNDMVLPDDSNAVEVTGGFGGTGFDD